MRYIVYFLFAFLCCTQTNALVLKATVNDIPISELDVQNWKRLLLFQQPQKYASMSQKQLQKEALDAAIESIVKKQTAQALGIKANQAEIAQARSHLEIQNGLAPNTLSSVLAKNKVPVSILNTQIESDLLWLNYLRAKGVQISVSNTAVEKRYRAMKADLEKKGVDGDHISLWEMAQGLFSPDVDVSTTLESKTCDAFLEHIKIGPYPESAQRGWVNPKQLPVELKEMLKDVAIGETFGPLRTPDGVLVMMKCDVKAQQVMPSKEQVKMQMEIEQMDVLSGRLLSEAMRRSVIERKE